ncbi:MAG TPA: DinB family protein [Methylomirabilota bacterium]|nr:DinB family protein [Methylomirabilota bacterium]
MRETEAAARQRLLQQLRTRAAALDLRGLRARVQAAGAEFEAALAGLDEAAARRPGPGGSWSAAQVVDHVAQSTVRGADELRQLGAGRRPPGPPVYEALLSGAAHRVPWAELLDGLRESRGALDEALAAGPPPPGAGPAATARAILVVAATPEVPDPEPFTAELTWPEYALVLRLHFLDHREQVRRLRAAHAAAS